MKFFVNLVVVFLIVKKFFIRRNVILCSHCAFIKTPERLGIDFLFL